MLDLSQPAQITKEPPDRRVSVLPLSGGQYRTCWAYVAGIASTTKARKTMRKHFCAVPNRTQFECFILSP